MDGTELDYNPDLVELPIFDEEKGIIVIVDLKWRIFVDGSSNRYRYGVGIAIYTPAGDIIKQALQFNFVATNHEAEYVVIQAGLKFV